MKNQPQILYIDPMVDFGFKKIFKDSGKKQLIIRPLNAIFGLDIADIDIRESEQLGLTEQERKVTYDMHCDTRDGRSFIIEVQLANASTSTAIEIVSGSCENKRRYVIGKKIHFSNKI